MQCSKIYTYKISDACLPEGKKNSDECSTLVDNLNEIPNLLPVNCNIPVISA